MNHLKSKGGNTEDQLIHGDCIQVMQSMLANSVDAIVTDPP
ncbi:unnamed protein product [marine sediment metagenome]|uniref:DNA methylase N-4/N-6 domain-containing protein n=1 Tax=marine sediment metagenome TaxID=412755 RepID=X0UKG8_9ZZZZ